MLIPCKYHANAAVASSYVVTGAVLGEAPGAEPLAGREILPADRLAHALSPGLGLLPRSYS